MKGEVYLEGNFFGEVNLTISRSLALIVPDEKERVHLIDHLKQGQHLPAIRFDGSRLSVELRCPETDTIWTIFHNTKNSGNELLRHCRENKLIETLEIVVLSDESFALPGMTVLRLGERLNHQMLSTTLRKLYLRRFAA